MRGRAGKLEDDEFFSPLDDDTCSAKAILLCVEASLQAIDRRDYRLGSAGNVCVGSCMSSKGNWPFGFSQGMTPRVFVAVSSLLGVMMGFACNSARRPLGRGGLVAVYTLVSVDGKPLPASVSHGGAQLQVKSGTMTFRPGQRCVSKTMFVPPSTTPVVREVAASYTTAGSNITMRWDGAGITRGTLDGDRFTMDNEGMRFVYLK